jgi:hypothetical protein
MTEEKTSHESQSTAKEDEKKPEEKHGGGVGISAGRDATLGDGAVVVGRDAHHVQTNVTRTHDPNVAQLEALFEELYQKIDASSSLMRDTAKGIVQQIEEEVTKAKGQPDKSKVENWLKGIKAMAPDIFDVAIATFANPPAGIAMVIKKIGEKIKAESGEG